MKTILICISITLSLLSISSASQAQSKCVGLSKTTCSAKSTCTWRKSSVNKNGVKTKAHCRALPKKTKKTTKPKKTTKSSTKPKKTTKKVK